MVEDMAGSKTGLGLRTAHGPVFEIMRIDNTVGGNYIPCRLSREVVANGESLPEPFKFYLDFTVNARAADTDFEEAEEDCFECAQWKCSTALANNPNLKGRLLSRNSDMPHYAWKDKELVMMASSIGKFFFLDQPVYSNSIESRMFDPSTVTTQEIDFALAKLFGDSIPTDEIIPDESVPSEFREYEIGHEPVDEIATNSLNNPKFVKIKNGTIAYGTDKGVGYKDHNEDVVVVNSEKNGFAVVDGMGGQGHGEEAAGLLAIELKRGFQKGKNFDDVHVKAHRSMVNANVRSGGACYIGAKIEGDRLNIGQAGDVKLMVIGVDGKIKYETTDQGFGNIVTNAVMGNSHSNGTTKLHSVDLAVGDRILVGSDGLFNNIPPEEIAEFVSGKTIQEAIQILNLHAKERMRDAVELKAAGLKVNVSDGKPDNISIVIYDVENLG